jgi:putative colanic acid biosynthesis UDP-glucose lipid carrier transferase
MIITRFMLVYFIKHLSRILLIGDYIIINLFFILGNLCFFDSEDMGFSQDDKAHIILLNISWFAITVITKPYKRLQIRESSLHFNALTKSLILLIASSYIYLSLLFSVQIDYKYFILYFLLIGLCMTFMRLILFLYRKKNRIKLVRTLYSTNTILIGENKLSKSILSNNHLRRSMGIRGVYSQISIGHKHRYLGDLEKLFLDLENVKINNIIFCDDEIELSIYKKILDIAEQKMIRIYMVPDFKYNNIGACYFDVIYGTPFLKMIKEPLSDPKKQIIKRTFDIIFSLLVIIFLLSWLIPIVALIIRLESNDSVFFKQKRSGLNNEHFYCIKFRSMTANNKADLQTATKNDARVTKFGRFMRKTSIDELPQFLNVFKGQMSVVGPRPHMISQTEIYSKITKTYMTRHIVKPGITGWAQVMGSRGEIFTHKDMERRVEKDIWYIQNWSFFLDIKIIFLTFYNILKGDEQAY